MVQARGERYALTLREDSMPLICLLPMHTSPTHPHACPRTKDSGDRSCKNRCQPEKVFLTNNFCVLCLA